LDNEPKSTPYSELSVVGMSRTIGVISPQTLNGVPFEFDSWSDGGAPIHSIFTPSDSTTYTAVYRVDAGRIGIGTGLTGTYYDNGDLTNPLRTRIDPTINFSWDASAPIPGMGADTFSVRWTGQVQPQFSQTYTFYTESSDGVRLWVNDKLIIDDWTDHPSRENSGSITLTAGQKYDIKMEYYDNLGDSVARLMWSSASNPKGVIPRSQLYPSPSRVFLPMLVVKSMSLQR
jgi:hypothetical protein